MIWFFVSFAFLILGLAAGASVYQNQRSKRFAAIAEGEEKSTLVFPFEDFKEEFYKGWMTEQDTFEWVDENNNPVGNVDTGLLGAKPVTSHVRWTSGNSS